MTMLTTRMGYRPSLSHGLSAQVRRMSAGVALRGQVRRLPSFADIRSVKLQEYQHQEDDIANEAIGRLREGIPQDGERSVAPGLIKSFLYGSPKIKEEQQAMEQSFSKVLMRGKYVHEIQIHKVYPDKAADYLDLVTEIYPRLAKNDNNEVHLVGSWRTVVGDMDTYMHIWEYNGYPGFHHTQNMIHKDQKYLEFLADLRACVRSRESNLMQEFSFWGGTASPRKLGGVFELRTYDLMPGKLLEWEQYWKKGIECRRQVMEPVGAWFTQLGSLNRVRHLWQFADLEHRKLSREKCWELPGWAETTHETVKLVNSMEANILVPLPFSPLK
uniref:ARAD1C37334p n=1 Tax=Blastobotrys adeninivorans TaxID=409370 RepID=A0A060T3Y1_BLAAD